MAKLVNGHVNSVHEPPKQLEKIFSMKGGKGENSYLKNSQAQARHGQLVLPFLEATLNTMKLPSREAAVGCFAVADLGCSCGTNTLFFMGAIVKHITMMFEGVGYQPPEVQVFFSDLPCSDFNLLCQLLPPLSSTGGCGLEECVDIDAVEQRTYFAAAVPGSFYGRLFPSRSINVFNSTFSLHWLSQVPESVMDETSAAYNRGRVFVHGASVETGNAYKRQFQADLTTFLGARAKEMRPSGVMFLVCLGRTSTDPTDQGGAAFLFSNHFQDAWDDLIQEGLLECGKRDDFNIPAYAPCLEEFREAVEAEGSFAINELKLVDGGSPLLVEGAEDAEEVGHAAVRNCRAVGGVLVEAHIGERLSEEVFKRMERRSVGQAREVFEKMYFTHVVAGLTFRDGDNKKINNK